MGQCLLQGADGLADELGAVIERHDGDFRHRAVLQRLFGHAAFHLGNLGLDVVDDIHRVRAVAGDNHATHGFLTLLVESASAVARAEVHLGNVLHADGHPVTAGDGGVLQVLQRLDIA